MLERAARDRVFIPWNFVTADAAVSGTISARCGYLLRKSQIESKTSLCRRLYIDEIGRASRDLVEALVLGRLIDATGKRMIGATDGFDSETPHHTDRSCVVPPCCFALESKSETQTSLMPLSNERFLGLPE